MEPATNIEPFDTLAWTATRYSDVLRIDRRVIKQALETLRPAKGTEARPMWHVREGMPAIFRRVFGVSNEDFDYRQLAPKDRLDHFRAERERLRLEAETRELIPASEVESAIAIALKQLAQTLDALPDTLDRAAGLSPEALDVAQRCIDSARDELFEALNHAFASDNPVSG